MRWPRVLGFVVVGAAIGAGVVILSTAANRYTSTEAFCTSCHAMASVAADPHYQQSAHRNNAAGVLATCADCHVPANNWFIETYSHAANGIGDAIAALTTDTRDPAVWSARLPALAERARRQLREQNSITCRKCHDVAAIQPGSAAGQKAHAMLTHTPINCAACHRNLVHSPTAGSSGAKR